MASTCFGLRPSSGSLQLSLAKVILIFKLSARLLCNLLCGGVAACPSMACVLCAMQSEILQSLALHGTQYILKLDGSYMFRSRTVIRELAIEPGKSYINIKTFSKVIS